MNDFEFKVLDSLSEVKETVADMSAKLNMLVGPDGTNGRFSEVVKEVDSLKDSRSRQHGAMAVMAFFGSIAGGAAEWFITRNR